MYEDVRNLSWLYCLDTILNTMSTRISVLREASENENGVVPKCAKIMESRWKNCSSLIVIRLEPGGDRCKVSRPEKMLSKLIMWLRYKKENVLVGCGKNMVYRVSMQWPISVLGQRKH
jgi:hypothetical protein